MRCVIIILTLCCINIVVDARELEHCGQEVVERGVSKEDLEVIVNKHNEFRIMVARGEVPNQPKGINLKRLYWDQGLAAASQQSADKCKFEISKNVADPRWGHVGQNMFLSRIWSMSNHAYNGSDWTSAIQTWFNEHIEYQYPFGRDSPHYTQLVWADTRFVGCGYISYKTSKYYINRIYICSYGPGGNVEGMVPYETGPEGCKDLC